MPCTEYQTWNPVMHLQVLSGRISSAEFLARTIRVRYVDRIKEHDTLEMEMLNSDGLFTDPRAMAAGMIVAIKMGYIDGSFPWKVFILNRMRGGLGVMGRQDPMVGQQESIITLFGTNRNAAGGKTGAGWSLKRRSAKSITFPGEATGTYTKKGKARVRKERRTFAATSDMLSAEMSLNRAWDAGKGVGGAGAQPRIVIAKSSAEAVRVIAQRAGFRAGALLVQDTADQIERVSIPAGRTVVEHLRIMSDQFGFEFKIDEGGILHWHSPVWGGDTTSAKKGQPVDTFVYGAGPDIIKLSVDADFRLPMPSKITRRGIDPMTRQVLTGDVDMMQATKASNVGRGYIRGLGLDASSAGGGSPEAAILTRDYEYPVVAQSLLQVKDKAQRDFIHQFFRGFMLSAECIGNPRLLAGKLLEIGGTGSIFGDGIWLIGEAHHTIQNGTAGGGSGTIVYGTNVRLQLPPADKAGVIRVVKIGDQRWWSATKQAQIGTGYVTGL